MLVVLNLSCLPSGSIRYQILIYQCIPSQSESIRVPEWLRSAVAAWDSRRNQGRNCPGGGRLQLLQLQPHSDQGKIERKAKCNMREYRESKDIKGLDIFNARDTSIY